MEYNYSIQEILLAVDKIENKKKEKKGETLKLTTVQKDYSTVPKNTLKLIEEAENN